MSRTKFTANAHIEQFLPHSQILARAVCAVTHGGAGVTQKALAAGVPVCVVPFGRDQLEVARRVEGTNRVADGFAATGGPAAAAEAIDGLLDGHSNSTRQTQPPTLTELASQ